MLSVKHRHTVDHRFPPGHEHGGRAGGAGRFAGRCGTADGGLPSAAGLRPASPDEMGDGSEDDRDHRHQGGERHDVRFGALLNGSEGQRLQSTGYDTWAVAELRHHVYSVSLLPASGYECSFVSPLRLDPHLPKPSPTHIHDRLPGNRPDCCWQKCPGTSVEVVTCHRFTRHCAPLAPSATVQECLL